MSNFTFEIKRDIMSALPEKRCCGEAMVAALLHSGGNLFSDRIEFISENEKIAAYFLRLTEWIYGIRPEISAAVLDPKRDRNKLTFSYAGERLEEIKKTALLPIPLLTRQEDCALSYIRGTFLGSGSATLPREGAKTGYHLELCFGEETRAEAFCEILSRFDLIAKLIVRGEKYVVYFKSGDVIADFLSVIGASSALRTVEKVSSVRAERNNENRVSNCYAGNADKAATASVRQTMMIARLLPCEAYRALPAPLRETAEARLTFAGDSLSELAARLNITKSCLNHRLRKLTELYKRIYEHD